MITPTDVQNVMAAAAEAERRAKEAAACFALAGEAFGKLAEALAPFATGGNEQARRAPTATTGGRH